MAVLPPNQQVRRCVLLIGRLHLYSPLKRDNTVKGLADDSFRTLITFRRRPCHVRDAYCQHKDVDLDSLDHQPLLEKDKR